MVRQRCSQKTNTSPCYQGMDRHHCGHDDVLLLRHVPPSKGGCGIAVTYRRFRLRRSPSSARRHSSASDGARSGHRGATVEDRDFRGRPSQTNTNRCLSRHAYTGCRKHPCHSLVRMTPEPDVDNYSRQDRLGRFVEMRHYIHIQQYHARHSASFSAPQRVHLENIHFRLLKLLQDRFCSFWRPRCNLAHEWF